MFDFLLFVRSWSLIKRILFANISLCSGRWWMARIFSIKTAKDEKIKIDSLIDVYYFFTANNSNVEINLIQIPFGKFGVWCSMLFGANYAFSDYDEVISIWLDVKINSQCR